MENIRRIDAPSEEVRAFREKEELKLIARELNIPVYDELVRKWLLEYQEPEALPNETKESRRERLSMFLAKKKRDNPDFTIKSAIDTNFTEQTIDAHTTQGHEDLLNCRSEIFKFVNDQRSKEIEKPLVEGKTHDVVLYASQTGFTRAVSSVRLISQSPSLNDSIPDVLIADWSGSVSLISLEDEMNVKSKISIPKYGVLSGLDVHDNNLISVGTGSGSIPLMRLIDVEKNQLQNIVHFNGHNGRVSAVKIHPCGKYLISASHDKTWRLWDISSTREILTQDGNTDKIACVDVNYEGSIVATGGFDKAVRLWDLRSGVLTHTAIDHAKEVFTITWSNNWMYATAGADNTCLVYDMRNQKMPLSRIYAHKNTISSTKFLNQTIITGSYDGTVKYWDTSNNNHMMNKIDLGSRVMSIDANSDDVLIAGKWDRSVDWCQLDE